MASSLNRILAYVVLLKHARGNADRRGSDESFNHFIWAVRFQHFPENAVTNSETNGEALYGRRRRFTQMKFPRNDMENEPYTHVMLVCSTVSQARFFF